MSERLKAGVVRATNEGILHTDEMIFLKSNILFTGCVLRCDHHGNITKIGYDANNENEKRKEKAACFSLKTLSNKEKRLKRRVLYSKRKLKIVDCG